MKKICVNCGSSPGNTPRFMAAAQELGYALVDLDCELIYGGADVGLMGKIADTVLAGGGKVCGIIPESFAHKVSHRGLTELKIVPTMHERKKMMFDLSDGFVALPGGFGTLEEIAEVLTWAQLGIHSKPCGLLNVNGYYDNLLAFFDMAVTSGFMKKEHRDMLLVSEDPFDLLAQFRSYKPVTIEKWVDLPPEKQMHINEVSRKIDEGYLA